MNPSYYQLAASLRRLIQQQRIAEAEGDENGAAQLKTATGRIGQQMFKIVEEDLKCKPSLTPKQE